MSLTAADRTRIDAGFDAAEGSTIALAVSGGGDSLALAFLAHEWAKKSGRALVAVTVDHGLRPEAAGEARSVGAFCREFSIPHTILKWQGWDGGGNLQAEARNARRRLIGHWAAEEGTRDIFTGHTLDDQAETVLMRLARGSGVDGLAGMAERTQVDGVIWHRPLLRVRRTALRDLLTLEGIPWIDDPSNEDTRFDRVKARQALAALSGVGIDAEGLAATAARMARARAALEAQTAQLARAAARLDGGDVLLNWPALAGASDEIRNRLVFHALWWVVGADYRPRAQALNVVLKAMAEGRSVTLQGCIVTKHGVERRFAREFNAVRDTVSTTGEVWDGRWHLVGPGGPVLEVRPLGETGLRACPDWRDSGLPRASALATPAVWDGARLVAAPLAGFSNGWQAIDQRARTDFASAAISD
ncbi:MAG: tRNA lysidine(34) synthetase TilS [Pseudomonadota bacterium]